MDTHEIPYDALPSKDSEDDTTDTESLPRYHPQLSKRWLSRLSSSWIILAQIAMLLTTIGLALFTVRARSMAQGECPKCYVDDEQCAQHMSAYCEWLFEWQSIDEVDVVSFQRLSSMPVPSSTTG